MSSSDERYTNIAIILHWTIAAMIIVQVLIGLDFPDPLPGQRFSRKPLLPLHICLGMLVLVFSVARVAWRLLHRAPPHPAGMKRWEVIAANATHIAFYVLMIGMPLTGWITVSAHQDTSPFVYGVFSWARFPLLYRLPLDTLDTINRLSAKIHDLLTVQIFLALLALHIGAVVKHSLVNRDRILRRMVPGGRK